VLEKRVAALDGGVAALAVASGQAPRRWRAELAHVGDNIVSSTDLYGAPEPVRQHAPPAGIEVRLSIHRPGVSAAHRRTDPCLLPETLPNPKLAVSRSPRLPISPAARYPLIVDNTAAPILARPFDHGAAVIVYSTTKYIGGHGTSIGGLIVDSGQVRLVGGAGRQPAAEHAGPQLPRSGLGSKA